MKNVEMFTDGGYRRTSKVGGWGVLLKYGEHTKELKGSERSTTNQRMELVAVIKGFRALTKPCNVVVTTDSQYVKNGITQWVVKWKYNGWKTSSRKPVKNKDLWLKLDKLVQDHQVSWKWVRGHTGHAGNERADQLANKAMNQLQAEQQETQQHLSKTETYGKN